ncbi:MAG: ATP-binding cassette domain-containing protein [Pseudomonadota bacterium]
MDIAPALQVEAVGFRFDTHLVFSDFSTTLAPGITWLRGPNGKGKTTLLRLMAGALAPQTGSIRLGELDCEKTPLQYRLASYFCGGDLPELPWLTVQEFLDIHMDLYPRAQAALVDAQLTAFGIGDVLSQRLSTLSLGQHKKVQLALALALPVRLLLVDEPFNGLDAAAIDYLRAQLAMRAAARDCCIVLTSHLDPQLPALATLDLP